MDGCEHNLTHAKLMKVFVIPSRAYLISEQFIILINHPSFAIPYYKLSGIIKGWRIIDRALTGIVWIMKFGNRDEFVIP